MHASGVLIQQVIEKRKRVYFVVRFELKRFDSYSFFACFKVEAQEDKSEETERAEIRIHDEERG